VAFLRTELGQRGILPCGALSGARDGQRVTMAGLVLARQRPATKSGVTFITIEDETGIANLVVWSSVFDQHRRVVTAASMLACRGHVQREGDVIHIVAAHLVDLSGLLRTLGSCDAHGRNDQVSNAGTGSDQREQTGRGPRTRDVYTPDLHTDTIKVKSRNFH